MAANVTLLVVSHVYSNFIYTLHGHSEELEPSSTSIKILHFLFVIPKKVTLV